MTTFIIAAISIVLGSAFVFRMAFSRNLFDKQSEI